MSNTPGDTTMLKKLGIAAACGVALYGLAKLLSRHVVVVLDLSLIHI